MSLDENDLKARLEKVEKIFEDQQQEALNEEALQSFSDKIADTLGSVVESKIETGLNEALQEKMERLAENLPGAISSYIDESIEEVVENLSEKIATVLATAIETIAEGDDSKKDDVQPEEDEKECDADKKDEDKEDTEEKNESVSEFDIKANQILDNLSEHLSYNQYQSIKELLDEQQFESDGDVRAFFEENIETEKEELAKPSDSFVAFCAKSIKF